MFKVPFSMYSRTTKALYLVPLALVESGDQVVWDLTSRISLSVRLM